MEAVKIPLGNGGFTLVDHCDHDWLTKWNWYRDDQGYVLSGNVMSNGKRGRMHRMIVGTPEGMDTDHINGDTLDNRRSNLRAVSRTVNNFNRKGLMPNNTSGHTGVVWHKKAGKWMAQMQYKGKEVYLGLHTELEDAVRARKSAEQEYGVAV